VLCYHGTSPSSNALSKKSILHECLNSVYPWKWIRKLMIFSEGTGLTHIVGWSWWSWLYRAIDSKEIVFFCCNLVVVAINFSRFGNFFFFAKHIEQFKLNLAQSIP
jgi:hypothetical protein